MKKTTNNIIEQRRCTRCRSPDLMLDTEIGEEVCRDCGLVLDTDLIDVGPEWRAFTQVEQESRARTGMPRTYTSYDKGLSTSFNTGKDSKGKSLDPKMKNKMRKLKRYDDRSKIEGTWARTLSIAMFKLNRLSDILHIPSSIKEKAAVIYREALEKDLIRGRSIDDFVAASVYASCRLNKVPRSLREVSEASAREHSAVSRTYRLLLRELDFRMPIDYPMKFVPKISSKIGVSREIDRLTIEILRRAKEQKVLTGKDPRGIAAAALYLACKIYDEGCSQKKVADAAGTTEVTLRNRLRDIEEMVKDMDMTSILPQAPAK